MRLRPERERSQLGRVRPDVPFPAGAAGLPGADWWVAESAAGGPQGADVELADVDALYTQNDLWPAVFDSEQGATYT